VTIKAAVVPFVVLLAEVLMLTLFFLLDKSKQDNIIIFMQVGEFGVFRD
jgi:hypothetical protein